MPWLLLPSFPLPSSDVGVGEVRSTREIRMIPIREARTPAHLRRVNFSTPRREPKIRVQTPGFGIILVTLVSRSPQIVYD